MYIMYPSKFVNTPYHLLYSEVKLIVYIPFVHAPLGNLYFTCSSYAIFNLKLSNIIISILRDVCTYIEVIREPATIGKANMGF